MPYIALDRRFIVWSDKDESDPELLSFLRAASDALGWEQLQLKRRVVVLAEAGSGKTAELEQQAKVIKASRRFAFYATVQNVGQEGLAASLPKADAGNLTAWKRSREPGWFFLDSIDEAKSNVVRLDDALRKLADDIQGAESRAHIVISGRHTNWEFRRDLESFEKWLPVPPPDLPVPKVDPERLIISSIRNERKRENPPPAETPLVVVMGALDRSQVQAFARGKGVSDTEEFALGLETANLWDFARRPLDLDWLVEYWRVHRRFGSLAQMLELSIRERLIEPDLQRAIRDPLEVDRALEALERIGAALVLERLDTIVVPDSSLSLFEMPRALDLAELLPDWSAEDRTRLISRAVFDPARVGLVRLHNDNLGSVRGFLAARWLRRLLSKECPRSVVNDLLFATTYGVPVVKPPMRHTAAWFSIWDAEVAREIVARDPRLLMDAGDPASLPVPVRAAVLYRVIKQVASDNYIDLPDRDSLKRFSQSDLAECARELWNAHHDSPAARELILLIIELGGLRECADIALGASFGTYSDRYTQVFSGRALMAVSVRAEKQRYANFIQDRAASLLDVVVWDAVETLFPHIISIAELLAMLKSMNLEGDGGGLGLDYHGPNLVEKLPTAVDVEALLVGLLQLLKTSIDDDEPHDEALLSTIEAGGSRLLELTSPLEAPAAAVDAAIRLGETRRYQPRRRSRSGDSDLFSRVRATPERRRQALWHAASRLAHSDRLDKKPLDDPFQMELLGFSLTLEPEDLNWLLRDASERQNENERVLAMTAAMQIWRRTGSKVGVLSRIKKATTADTAVTQVIAEWSRPRTPSEAERRHRRAMQRRERQYAMRQAAEDSAWIAFARKLRNDPDQLRHIEAPKENRIDARLYNSWTLLNAVGANRSRYAIDDLSPLEPILGTAAVEALREAFIKFWREWQPRLRSDRPPEERNAINTFDCVGIVGITLESKFRPAWAKLLSFEEAVLAAKYATLELNGFPNWFDSLSLEQPEAVLQVLTALIALELEPSDDRAEVLRDISHESLTVTRLVSPYLFDLLEQRDELPTSLLDLVLLILRQGFKDNKELAPLLLSRVEKVASLPNQAAYLATLFSIDADVATAALIERLSKLDDAAQVQLAQMVLPRVFGDRWERQGMNPGDLPLDCLERLILAAYKTIRLEDDNVRSSREAYSPDERDHAESARSSLFKALLDIPGPATYATLLRLADSPEFPIDRRRLISFSIDRAATDSESAPWTSREVQAFEIDSLIVPHTPIDLQRVVLGRLTDLQHELLHTDFAQGGTVARLPSETAVQNWFANTLRARQGRSYSVERETRTVEEKEPDIRFRARATDASVPMEIKVAESWTYPELEAALTMQLVGQYLRDRGSRYGVLLLVHQEHRSQGWRDDSGAFLSFEKVVERLKSIAVEIAARSPFAPQAELATIDVSSVAIRTGKPKSAKSKSAKSKSAKSKSAKSKSAKSKSAKSKSKQGRSHSRRTKSTR